MKTMKFFRHLLLAVALTMFLPAVSVAQTATTPIVVKKLKCEKSKYKGYLSLRIDLEYPAAGPEAMVRTLTDTMLNSICLARSFTNDTIYPYEFAANWKELPSVLWNSLRADWKELDAMGFVTKDDMRPLTLEANGKCIANTPRFASFELFTYIWPMGAGHWMPAAELYTADATTGKLVLATDIFRHPESDELEELLFRELYDQFEPFREMIDEQEPGNLYWQDAALSLPSCSTVALVPEGVRVQYQAYEIGPYVIGMPTCVLPLRKIRHLLTPYALSLLGD